MRNPRATCLAALVAVLAVLATVGGPAAQADAPAPTDLALTRVTPAYENAVFHDHLDPGPSSLPGVPGVDVMAYRAQLTSSGVPVAGASVLLQRRLSGATTWRRVDTDTTDDQGAVDFSTPVKGNAAYRARYAGSDAYASADSDPQALAAMRDFNARIVWKAGRPFLQGNINPGWNHRKVWWEKRRCDRCDWRTIDVARSGDSGGWSFRGGIPPAGATWRFRARLDRTADFVRSTSSIMMTARN